jgi:glycerol-3-phosphate O-acyltransferase / dihydroxyacetone phosphate acyltransferase
VAIFLIFDRLTRKDMLYEFLKKIVQISLAIFFRQIKVRNKEFLQTSAPLIVVANHPNTLIDPLVITSFLPHQLYFLANASLFNRGWKNRIMTILHMIPIFRKQDLGKTNLKVDNDAIFERCFEFLEKKGSLLIFPEGTSFIGRHLREIKTGTARIALGAEARNDFKLGIQILSVGLNYSDPSRFRSEVFANLEKPIALSDYKELYSQNPEQAIRQLTERIRQQLEAQIVLTSSQENDAFLLDVEMLYKSTLASEMKLKASKSEGNFWLSQKMAEALDFFEQKEASRILQLKKQVRHYASYIRRLQLTDNLLDTEKSKLDSWFDMSVSVLYLLFGFPIYLYGLINNYIPYILPSFTADRITKAIEFRASIMLVINVLCS